MCAVFRNMEVIGNLSQMYFHRVTEQKFVLEWIEVWLVKGKARKWKQNI